MGEHLWCCENAKLARDQLVAKDAEIERLVRVIARELSENDELGAEYTYVMALKAEIERLKGSESDLGGECEMLRCEKDQLRAELAAMREALDKVLIKVDWNGDEFSSPKQYAETRQLILNALALPAAQAAHERWKALERVADTVRQMSFESSLLSEALAALDAAKEEGET